MAGYIGIKDLTGQKFGRLSPMWPAGMKRKMVYWICLCDCGKFAIAAGAYIKYGNIRSCGCLRRELTGRKKRTHGRTDSLEYRMWKPAGRRAKLEGIPFNITLDDIYVPTHCPLLGVKLDMEAKRYSANAPVLDKIIPEKGYTTGNVQVISARANRIKHDATLEEFERIAANWRARCESRFSEISLAPGVQNNTTL